MARIGRPPKPTRLKLLAGNPGKRPLNPREPRPAPKLPKCPDHLTEAARKEWRRVGRELGRLGMVSLLDRAGLAAYCQAWGRWVEAEEKLKRFGAIVKSPSGYPMQSPYLAVANQALRQMTALLVEFGMTPASRSRISVPGSAEPAGDAHRWLG